ANTTLHEMSIADPSTEGMGTTLTALLWAGAQVALCHIGDSRAYLLRAGELYQITRDHTLVQSLVDEGRLSPAAAATHPQRSLVMRALQGSSDAEPDLGMREAMIGDRYLLCSDGLSDVVTLETLRGTLAASADPEQTVLQLIDLAIRSGGPDNITCIVADVVDALTGPAPPSQTTMLAGAAASGDGRPLPRGNSPATRAHLLTQDVPASTDTSELEPVRDDDPRAGRHESDLLDDGRLGSDPGRRGWPIVSSVLAVLVILIGASGFIAYRLTQSQYYVGSYQNKVVIFRGINESVAGLSLSSAYQHTGIPVSHVQTSVLSLPTASGSLSEAQRTVRNIRRGYTCEVDVAKVTQWTADKPPPPPVIPKGHKPTAAQAKAINAARNYPPKPAVPAYCPAQGAG
ncbi:MAG: PP2C family protein-serine/threonine phosphatase, partial [Streptosporangiaceae bacterium]